MYILAILVILALILGIGLALQLGYIAARAIQRRNRARLNSERSREMRLAFERQTGQLAAQGSFDCGVSRNR